MVEVQAKTTSPQDCGMSGLAVVVAVSLSLFSGCAVTRHTLDVPGFGSFDRIDFVPFGQTAYSFTLDSNWPIALAIATFAVTATAYAWRRWRSLANLRASQTSLLE